MKIAADSVDAYLAALPADRREALQTVRSAINAALPAGYAEGVQYGMIGWFVPHSLYAPGYHCNPKEPLPYVGLASQKNYMSVYLMCVYGNPKHEAWFREAWGKTGKKLDMGKSCVRFRKVEDLALDVVARAVALVQVEELIRYYEAFDKRVARGASA